MRKKGRDLFQSAKIFWSKIKRVGMKRQRRAQQRKTERKKDKIKTTGIFKKEEKKQASEENIKIQTRK